MPDTSKRPVMTSAELLAIRTTTVDLETGNRAFGLGRSLGYRLAREGQYPCRVITAAKAHRVVTADLLRVLGVAHRPECCHDEGADFQAPVNAGLVRDDG